MYAQSRAEEEKRRIHIEKEEQAEREWKEREEDALRAQRLMEFESLAVSNLHFATRMKVLTINISLMALIWVRILTAGRQAFPLATVAFHAGIVMTHLHYRSLHLPLLRKNQQIFILMLLSRP